MKTILYFFCFFLFIQSFGQADTNCHKRAIVFKIKDGIYLSFKQLHQNSPIARENILTETHEHLCYYKELLRHEYISYTDPQSDVRRVLTDSILGYAIDGAFYLFNNNDHIRLNTNGTIAFVGIRPIWEQKKSEATLTSSSTESARCQAGGVSSRFYNNEAFSGGFCYPPSFYASYMPDADFELKTIYEYLIDFENDSIMEFSHKNLKLILKRDPELYTEYMKLSSNKQRKMEVVFLRKYNERHPFVQEREERDVVGF